MSMPRVTRFLPASCCAHWRQRRFFPGRGRHGPSVISDVEQFPPYFVKSSTRDWHILTEDVRLLLQVATVVGQEVPLTLWQNVSGADDEVLAAAIEQGKSAHLILDDSRGNFRFRHALFREVVYDDITALRRRHLHTAAAEALLSLTEPDPDVIAYHFQRAADARAIGWLIRAGERAQRSYAWLQAADRFDAAQRLLESDAPRARERAWLLYRIARLKRFANPSDGIAYLETAERLARQLGDRVLAAHALAARGVLRCYAGDDRQGLVEMEAGDAALEQLATEHVELDEFSQHWAVDAIASGRLPVSRTTQVMTNTRRGTFATRLAMVGRVREGRELAQRHIAAFEQLHDLDAAMIESHADAIWLWRRTIKRLERRTRPARCSHDFARSVSRSTTVR